MLIAVGVAAAATALVPLPIETIGTRFGGIPAALPVPRLPELSADKVMAVLPAALSFTLLGAIESLLSAVVADGMTGRRHRSNGELVVQGCANVGASLFGGFCVTGTIARTATNVRSGAHGPVAGMLHAVFLLLFIVVAAPLAAFIPLAALAGVLVVVAWNMIEKPAIAILLRSGWGEATVLGATFLLTVFRDLTEAIVVGFALGSVLFIHRMSRTTEVAADTASLRVAQAGKHHLDEGGPEDADQVGRRASRPAGRDRLGRKPHPAGDERHGEASHAGGDDTAQQDVPDRIAQAHLRGECVGGAAQCAHRASCTASGADKMLDDFKIEQSPLDQSMPIDRELLEAARITAVEAASSRSTAPMKVPVSFIGGSPGAGWR